jgi:hypothetical protein
MVVPCYPRTKIPIRRGDLVRWYNDKELSTVVFVVSTGDFAEDDPGKDWFQSEFGEGVMIDTPGAGWVLESEDCENIELVHSVAGDA